MPGMTSLTTKKADNTTDITYDALSASGGDGSPAVWRQDTGAAAGLPVGLRAMFKAWTQWNGPKTARQMKLNFVMPYAVQDSTTTLYSAKDRVVFDAVITIPQGIPASVINEAVAQCFNLCGTSLIKSSGQAGYAPT
nr:MAG: hypothetical protein [Sanya fiers-like virus 52]